MKHLYNALALSIAVFSGGVSAGNSATYEMQHRINGLKASCITPSTIDRVADGAYTICGAKGSDAEKKYAVTNGTAFAIEKVRPIYAFSCPNDSGGSYNPYRAPIMYASDSESKALSVALGEPVYTPYNSFLPVGHSRTSNTTSMLGSIKYNYPDDQAPGATNATLRTTFRGDCNSDYYYVQNAGSVNVIREPSRWGGWTTYTYCWGSSQGHIIDNQVADTPARPIAHVE